MAYLPLNVDIFVDANLLAYFFIGTDRLTQSITQFFKRGANADLRIHSSAQVISDVIPRAMLTEAISVFHVEAHNAVQYLKEHPERAKTLHANLNIPTRVYHELGINILPVTHVELHASRRFRKQYGLLTNDSLIVATMQRHKIIHLATNDRDFERVQKIQVWYP